MSRQTYLPYSPPTICQEEIDEVVDTLRSEWITTGPKTKAFERQFGEYLGAPDGASVMLNSCTAGLHVALVTLGIGPGDEVIVPTLTFAATANVVEHVGATPVLVDVLPDTMCIDPEAVREALTPRTRAVIPVHYAGHPAELDAIFAIAEEHGLEVIEDAAHALPARYRGAVVGSRDNLAAFSFYATKNLTTIEGGALTGRAELLERARVTSLHGMSADGWKRFDKTGSWQYDIVMPGFKYNMTDVQAAIGQHQLRRLERFHQRRRQVASCYCRSFISNEALEAPVELAHVDSAWHLYVLRLRTEHLRVDRNEFIRLLNALNIGTSVHYTPLHMMSFYREKYGYRAEDFPVAHDAFERMLSIPLHPGLADSDVQDVVEAVLETVERHRA
ncbi:MAG: DegT/DnrJ/EryC1/StrS aminotransferase family protein [Trueperaceae bacterium]